MRLLILIFLAYPILVFSEQEPSTENIDEDRLRISGFGTLGVTYAGKENFGHRKEFTHPGQFGNFSIFSGIVSKVFAELISRN